MFRSALGVRLQEAYGRLAGGCGASKFHRPSLQVRLFKNSGKHSTLAAYSTLLYSTLLYSTLLYYAMLCYTILCSILYYTILYYAKSVGMSLEPTASWSSSGSEALAHCRARDPLKPRDPKSSEDSSFRALGPKNHVMYCFWAIWCSAFGPYSIVLLGALLSLRVTALSPYDHTSPDPKPPYIEPNSPLTRIPSNHGPSRIPM